MTREEMIQLADPTTFQPFVIVTGSGQRFRVPHPDYIDIPPFGQEEDEDEVPSFVTVYTTGKAAIARFIVLANIQEIEFQKEAPQ